MLAWTFFALRYSFRLLASGYANLKIENMWAS